MRGLASPFDKWEFKIVATFEIFKFPLPPFSKGVKNEILENTTR
jgi:hypothetical protein